MTIRIRNDVDRACAILGDVLERTRHTDRRGFLAALGKAAAGSALLAAFSRTALSQNQAVTAFISGGTFKADFVKAFGDPFFQKTGLPIRYQEPYNFGRLRVMHEAKSQQIDMSSSMGREIIIAKRLGMTTPIDWSIVDRAAMSEGQLQSGVGVGGFMLSLALCYNKKKWPGDDHPKSWADFWNVEKFPGRRALRRNEAFTVETALLADGVTEDKFYPLDVDRAFRSLDRIKPHIKVWWGEANQGQQLVEQQEVDLIDLADGRVNEVINNGAPFEVVWNQAICTGNGQTWFVPAGSPNPRGGMMLIDFLGRAEPQAAFARLNYYAPQNLKAYEFIPPALANRLATHPDNLRLAHITNHQWWADNSNAVARRFQLWLQS